MKVIIGGFLVFIGIAWAALLGLMALIEALASGPTANPGQFLNMMIIGAVMVVIGLPLFLVGRREEKKAAKIENNILANGLPARARVTFVDKNYSVLVNQKPVFSSIEFTFEDHRGQPRTGRCDDADSDWVIRAQIQVGSEVDIRFLAANPDENRLVPPEADRTR